MSAMPKLSPTRTVANNQKKRRVLVVGVTLCGLLIILCKGPSALSQHRGPPSLSDALRMWEKGAVPIEVIRAAALCTPRDAVDAVLQTVSNCHDGLHSFGVIDVGANKGYPATRLALQHKVQWVLSIEPDPRNYKELEKLSSGPTSLTVVRGAASNETGASLMAFDDKRDDFTCFGCLNMSRDGVRQENVKIHTLDGLINDGMADIRVNISDIALLKTDTQGHEDSVFQGAERLLKSGRVLHAIMEFDPKLLRTKAKALAALRSLFDAGLQCVPLSVAPLSDEETKMSSRYEFGEAVTSRTAEKFYDFMVRIDKYTDVLCVRRSG